MLNFWSSHNKITSKALQVQYVSTQVARSAYGAVYEWHRIATKTYSYIGMDELTAKKCMEAKLAQYTRLFTQLCNQKGQYLIYPIRETKCVANVDMHQDESGTCSVEIDVHEDQKQYFYVTYPYEYVIPYNYFDLSIDYDEDPPEGAYLCISRVYRENARLNVAYSQEIKNFSRTSPSFHIEWRAANSSTWTAMTPTSNQDGLIYFNTGSWSEGYIRLRWGDGVISNEVGTPDVEHQRTLVLSDIEYVQNGTGWIMKYSQDFALWDAQRLILQKKVAGGSWEDVTTDYTVHSNGTIYTNIDDYETVQSFRANFDGVTSNTLTTLPGQIIVASALNATVESNQVTTCVITFYPNLAAYDDTKVSIRYSDSHGSRTFGNSDITIVQGEGVSRTATFSVGNAILGTSMEVSARILYDGVDGAAAKATVTRT